MQPLPNAEPTTQGEREDPAILPGVERWPAPMAMQRLIFWLASILACVTLFVVGAIIMVATLNRDEAATGIGLMMGLCVALTGVPLLVWEPSLAARIAGLATVGLGVLIGLVAIVA